MGHCIVGQMQDSARVSCLEYIKVKQNDQEASERINFRVHVTGTGQINLTSTASICIVTICPGLALNELGTWAEEKSDSTHEL